MVHSELYFDAKEHNTMKSLTIHGLDTTLEELIREKAKAQNASLNQTIKKLLRKSLGINHDIIKQRREEFSEFCGVWSKKDERDFNKKTKSFEKIDDEDWK